MKKRSFSPRQDKNEDLERDIQKPARNHEKKKLLNIYDRYNQVITTWAGYKEEEEYLTCEKEEPNRAAFKIGRNDPCPCSSGRKFKKCCFEKYQRFEC